MADSGWLCFALAFGLSWSQALGTLPDRRWLIGLELCTVLAMEKHLLMSRFLFFLHFRKYWECSSAVVYQVVHVRHGYSRHGHCMKKFCFDQHVFGATVDIRMTGEGCDFKSFMQCSDISIKSLAARSRCIVGKTCACALVCAFVVQCLPPIICGALWCLFESAGTGVVAACCCKNSLVRIHS